MIIEVTQVFLLVGKTTLFRLLKQRKKARIGDDPRFQDLLLRMDLEPLVRQIDDQGEFVSTIDSSVVIKYIKVQI